MDRPPFTARARTLASLFYIDEAPACDWTDSDLAAICRHQFGALLADDLAAVDAQAVAAARTQAQDPRDPIRTFADLLHHRNPPADLLLHVKRFAKLCRAEPSLGLPAEVAMVLYYAVLARSDGDATDLDQQKVTDGIQWALNQPWLDNATRSLFAAALKR